MKDEEIAPKPARRTSTRGPDWLLALRAGGSAEIPDLRGARLVGLDLSELDLAGRDLSGADLSRCRLVGTCFFGADLAGASFFEAQMEEAEFGDANLTGANLERVKAKRAGFGRAKLVDASLNEADLEGASLPGVELSGARLLRARLDRARLRDARLTGADFTGASFVDADLSDAHVDDGVFRDAVLRGAQVGDLVGFRTADWIGADARDVQASHAYGFRRWVADQNFLDEFQRANPILYHVWKLTSDCGRSVERWITCTGAMSLFFAFAYHFVDIDYGDHRTWFSPLYFSIVTMTTLGYGDAVPASVPAQMLAVSQAVLGYVMLGGLLSILSEKLARRAG
ncbi:MAG: pentapeptide repeat-containing protein [Planctomycetota bacterium]